MSDLREHNRLCIGNHFWCKNGIAECNACGRKFNEKTGKEIISKNPNLRDRIAVRMAEFEAKKKGLDKLVKEGVKK